MPLHIWELQAKWKKILISDPRKPASKSSKASQLLYWPAKELTFYYNLSCFVRLAAMHPIFDQIINDRGIRQRRGVAQGAEIILGYFAQNAAHDFARAGFR